MLLQHIVVLLIFLNVPPLFQSSTCDNLFNKSYQEPDDIDWKRYWNPKLSIDNLISESSDNKWQQLQWDRGGRGIVMEKRRLRGTFLENMELNEFPFDYQVIIFYVHCFI